MAGEAVVPLASMTNILSDDKRQEVLGLRSHNLGGGRYLGIPHTAVARPLPAPLTRLALPAGTRYNTSGLGRSLRWPVLACPRMAGFEVSTEGCMCEGSMVVLRRADTAWGRAARRPPDATSNALARAATGDTLQRSLR